jgi:hypothetical protein
VDREDSLHSLHTREQPTCVRVQAVLGHAVLVGNRESLRCRCRSVPSLPSVPNRGRRWLRGLHGGDVASCGSARQWARGSRGGCGCDVGCVGATHGVLAPHGLRFEGETLSQRAVYHLRLPPPNRLHPAQMNPPNFRRSTQCGHGDGARNVHDGQLSADEGAYARMVGLEGGYGERGGHSGGHAHPARSRCWRISHLRTRGTTTTTHSWLTCDQL